MIPTVATSEAAALYQSTPNQDLINRLLSSKPGCELILDAAFSLVDRVHDVVRESCTSPAKMRRILKTRLAGLEHEELWLVLTNNQHELLALEKVSQGTIDSSAVYPREIIKKVLKWNAAAVFLAHNHPSGKSDPSQADINLTRKIKTALNTIDVRLLDHFVIGANVVSFAELGIL